MIFNDWTFLVIQLIFCHETNPVSRTSFCSYIRCWQNGAVCTLSLPHITGGITWGQNYQQAIVSSKNETPLFWGNPSPLLGTPSFWSKFKKLPPPSESHPNRCMQIVRNILNEGYVSYYTKSIEDIINITLFTFRHNSEFTTDTFFS